MNDRIKNNPSELTTISEPHQTLTTNYHPVEEESKKEHNFKDFDQNKKIENLKNQASDNGFIQEKLPENMKVFLKNKRIISTITFYKKEESQNEKISNKLNLQPLETTNDHINESSMTNFQVENKEKLEKNKPVSNKKLNKIVHTEISSYCTICEGKIEEKMTRKKVFNCSHIFCYDCTKNYIIYKIDRFELISCPNENCKEALNISSKFYENEVTLKYRKKYKNIEQFYQSNNINEKLCPMEECEGIIKIDQSLKEVVCNICKSSFCTKCYSKVHEGECINFETSFMIKSLNLVQCEKCKNFIEKIEGCHHITCKCGYEFCEKCKEKWKKSHICKYTILNGGENGWGGCDWGLTSKDHIYFLLKIPLKFILVILCTLFWILFSFLGTPINIALMLYWLYLLLIKPSIEMIKMENQYWKIMFYVVFFPFWIIINICKVESF